MERTSARPWSCDSYVVQADASRDGRLIFGKNSDRPAGEAQPLRMVPARDAGPALQLAYVAIDDAPSYAHLGAAPFWCWGYEFGVNERDVAIGNEAQFTRPWAEGVAAAKAGHAPEAGIIGMELVRLGLERGGTATEALEVMTELLERYGQWASGAFGKGPADGAYDNSYLIADPSTAWILETSGRDWVAREVTAGVYSISNEPSIRTEYDRASASLVTNARERGWLVEGEPFDYAAAYTDPMTALQVSHMRQRRSTEMLRTAAAHGGVGLLDATSVLRDHFENTFLAGPYFNAARPDFLTLCMHEHPAGFTWGNTAGSTVIQMRSDPDDLMVIWWTPLTPCVGAYIPLFLTGGELPASLLAPLASEQAPRRPEEISQAEFDPNSYWWRFQNLLDVAKGDDTGVRFTEHQAELRLAFDRLEAGWIEAVDELRDAWRRTAHDSRRRFTLAQELQDLTSRAVDEVAAVIDTFFLKHAPEARERAVDRRWGGAT
jgi:secernin